MALLLRMVKDFAGVVTDTAHDDCQILVHSQHAKRTMHRGGCRKRPVAEDERAFLIIGRIGGVFKTAAQLHSLTFVRAALKVR